MYRSAADLPLHAGFLSQDLLLERHSLAFADRADPELVRGVSSFYTDLTSNRTGMKYFFDNY